MKFIPKISFFLFSFISISFGPASSGMALNEYSKNLQRRFDVVVITADDCRGLTNKPISNYGLYALKNEKLEPVPFQIDEVNKKGDFVFTHGKIKSDDKNINQFDLNDQLVFMAKDTGDKITKSIFFPKKATGCLEITVEDPISTGKGWVYLISFSAPPLLSEIDYVNYDSGQLKAVAWNYTAMAGTHHPVTASKYAFREKIGGDDTDIIDRVKLRITMKIFVTFHKTEEDIKVTENGYIDGPVRVIVNSTNKIPLIFGLPASITHQNTFYYFGHADFPLVVDVPIIPDPFFISIIDDFSHCNGWTFYSSTNPEGHVIDGMMNDADNKLNLSPFTWSVLSNEKFAFWVKCLYPPNSPVKADLYFNDDIKKNDRLEEIPGENPGAGLYFKEGWKKVKDYPVEFRILHFFTQKYSPGDEKNIMNIHDQPLKTMVNSID